MCVGEANTRYYSNRLAEVVARERKEKGLIGLRIFASVGDSTTNETIAKGVLALHDDALAGNAEDITDTEI